jgi:hypothetical protein
MLESLYCISAADCLPHDESGNGSPEVEGGSSGSSASALVSASGQNKSGLTVDVWISMQNYKKAIVEADGSLFIFNAFADQLRRQSQQAGSRVSALLHSLIKVFAGEQVRVWQDASLMLRRLAPASGSSSSPSAGESSPPSAGMIVSVNAAPSAESNNGVEPDQDVDDSVAEETPLLPVLPDCVPAVKVGHVQFLQLTKQAMQDLTALSANSLQHVSLDGRQSSVSRSSAAASAKDDSYLWKPAVAVITFDHYLHLFRPDPSPLLVHSEYASNNCWISDEPLISVDIAGAEIEPVLFSMVGVRDAFDIRVRSTTAKPIQSRRPSASGASKSNAAAVANGGHLLLHCGGRADETQEWMRLVSNPLSDPKTAAPESTSLASLNAGDIHKQKTALLASFVQPPPYVEGTEI